VSRVTKPKNKWVNSVKYSPEVYEPSKVTIINKGKMKTVIIQKQKVCQNTDFLTNNIEENLKKDKT
jgi:hypothetical protein